MLFIVYAIDGLDQTQERLLPSVRARANNARTENLFQAVENDITPESLKTGLNVDFLAETRNVERKMRQKLAEEWQTELADSNQCAVLRREAVCFAEKGPREGVECDFANLRKIGFAAIADDSQQARSRFSSFAIVAVVAETDREETGERDLEKRVSIERYVGTFVNCNRFHEFQD